MIEPTDEMLKAFDMAVRRAPARATDLRERGIRAVLAIVERDYEPRRCDEASWTAHRCTKPRGHDGGHYHRWSGVVWP